MSPFSSIIFITLGLFLTSLVEGPPFEDECDDSSFDVAFYNQSTLFILKNPYVYTWEKDLNVKGFSGKLKSKEHRYRYWPEIDDQITAACSAYDEEWGFQIYIFMNDKMMYLYANLFNRQARIWDTIFWEHNLEEIPNFKSLVPTCVGCSAEFEIHDRITYFAVKIHFVNSDLTEIRFVKSRAKLDQDSFMDPSPYLWWSNVQPADSGFVRYLDRYLNKTQSCLHYAESANISKDPTLIFTGNKMMAVRRKGEPLILPVDETLFGCVELPSFLSEVAIGLTLWSIAVLTTLLPMLYFILTNPRGDESRSQSKSRGQDDQLVVKESKEGKQGRFVMEPFRPLRQRIHWQKVQQPVGEEDTIRTIISTG